MNKIQSVIEKIKKHSNNKKLLMFLSLMLLLAVGSSVTLAFLHKEPEVPLTNTFIAANQHEIEIQEDFNGKIKDNVKITLKNNKGYSVYVRAAVVATWKKGDEVLGVVPKEEDYNIVYGDAWFKGEDGFWYCKAAIGGSTSEATIETPVFIESCTVNNPAPDDSYHLSVEIMAQSIQVAGKTKEGIPAVTDVWGVGVAADGSLTTN